MKKYILLREEFNRINEVFENDITWGGSLLGRLINSTIHSVVRKYKTHLSGIDNLVSEFKSEMKSLYGNYLEDEELLVKAKALLEKIRECVYDGTPIVEFLGDGTKDGIGLITESIEVINSVNNVSDKDKKMLSEKLENFRKELMKIKNEEKPTQTKNMNLKDVYSLSFLKKPLIQVLGKNTIDIPMVQGMNYWDKFITGDLSFTKDSDPFMKKFPDNKLNLANNIKTLLTLPEFVNYVKTKDSTIYQYLVEAINGSKGNNNQNNTTPQPAPNNKKPSAVPINYGGVMSEALMNSSKGTLWNIFSDRLTNVIGVVIQHFDNWVATKNNEKQMQTIFYKGVKDKMERNVNFALEQNDTLENLSYSIMQISDSDIQQYKTTNSGYDNNKMYSDIIRRKLNETIAKNNIHISTNEEQKFSQTVISLIKRNKINENVHTIQLSFERLNEATNPKLVIQEVVDAWKLFFTENDENKWCLNKNEANTAAKRFDNKNVDLNTISKSPDPVIRIVNIFIKAYNMYTTDYIPSGRPNGKVSLKTFRQYRYAGEGSTNATPDNPGYGKWILISAYNKFNNGIMKALEDTELRQILANPRLTINGNKGAGSHLMNFINEMLKSNANMDKARFTLLTKYFNINQDVAKPLVEDIKTDKSVNNKKPKPDNDDNEDGDDTNNTTNTPPPAPNIGTKLLWKKVDKIVLNPNISKEFYAFEAVDLSTGNDIYFSTYMINYDDAHKILAGKFVNKSAVLASTYVKIDGKTIEELRHMPIIDKNNKIYFFTIKGTNVIEDGFDYKMIFCDVQKDPSVVSNLLKMDINISTIYKLTNDDGSDYKLSDSDKKELTKEDKKVDKKDFIPYLTK